MSEAARAQHIDQLRRDLLALLDRQALIKDLVQRQSTPRQKLVQGLIEREQSGAVRTRLAALHPAEVAGILEGLPLAKRRAVWSLIAPQVQGAVLLELADAVRESLLADLERVEILNAALHLDSDELADLVPDLPPEMVPELLGTLAGKARAEVQSSLSFPPDTVGALMGFEHITVRADKSLEVVLRYLRRRGSLPNPAHPLFVIDRAGTLCGLLSLADLVLHEPERAVAEVMRREWVGFHTDDDAAAAARSFARYELIAAPVLNAHGLLVGLLTVDAVMAWQRARADLTLLKQAGLRAEEDLFAPVLKSGPNRWPWLAANLFTAFIASRVISTFEDAIGQTLALAALMPIVASIGGNTGNQTVALVIRGLALQQLGAGTHRRLLLKEGAIGLLNGSLWGLIMAGVTLLLYGKLALAGVMLAAMVLNLGLASLAGVLIPLALKTAGRDPVFGSSVLLTALTDSMGFFIFLGLASWWLP